MNSQIRSLSHAVLFVATMAFRCAKASNTSQRAITTIDDGRTTIAARYQPAVQSPLLPAGR